MSSNQSRRSAKKVEERWFFSKNEIEDTPSASDGIGHYDELRYRQHAANLIQECGKQLKLAQLPINTAIVFSHRFFMVHSFKKFNKYDVAAAALFLASKVEESPRKVEQVLKVKEDWTRKGASSPEPPLDPNSEEYQWKLNQLIDHELLMLQTFGFDVTIDHPHKHVIKATQFMRAPRELSHVAYFMATNSLNLTTFCLEMRPEVVAATCIYLSIKWSKFKMDRSSEGREWWSYLDPTLTEDDLILNVKRYIDVLKEHPTRLTEIKQLCPGTAIETHSLNNSNLSASETSSNDHNSSLSHRRISSHHHNQSSNSTSHSNKRPYSAEDSEGSKRMKTESRVKEEPKPTLPPVRLPGSCSRDRMREIESRLQVPESGNSSSSKMPSSAHKSNSSNSASSNSGRPGSYLPRLTADERFVKECLRQKELWAKLSDEEKEYCKSWKVKEKKRKEHEKIRESRARQSASAQSSINSSNAPIRAPPDLSESHRAVDQIANELLM
ncbi:Oidioi.mRNA.OKI2018_I69.XSR.g16785.t1.cds [Oikopleura dioica]|uniref:Oidioi.mRNA.OKI2018_I69.XSR.g16785.t1.cds n=1 Tax=Oikopleura dioica TaxID=34765 RepID=A0ABN7SHP4_OIKDI|nr:Oidioi.mRNA.OKI2018_I69.XSR.g16785.t1.cds [Oikopleura dioica]